MSIEVEWARMTAPELRAIAAREGALAILPAGSLEQHGPHLPVITDTASASAAAIAAALILARTPVSALQRSSDCLGRPVYNEFNRADDSGSAVEDPAESAARLEKRSFTRAGKKHGVPPAAMLTG